jgi:hypothetical protein
MPATKTWGIYVYYAADVLSAEMQAAARTSLVSLASAGSNEDVGITAMIDLPKLDTAYYILPEQPTGQTTWDVYPDRFLPNVNSASLQTIADFLQWSSDNCPAENIALVFWGHAYALDDYDPTQGQGAGTGDDSGKGRAGQRSAAGFPGRRGQELSLLYDSSHDAVLNNRDFGGVLRSYNVSLAPKKKIQVLALDCCNMAMVEVLSELQDYAEFSVAAESMLPYRSWLTQQVLEQFLHAGNISPQDFAKAGVNMFIDSYMPSQDPYLALSVCNLARCQRLEEDMKELTGILIEAIDEPENREAIDRAWLRDVSFLADGLIDLGRFCEYLQQGMREVPGLYSAAGKVREAVKKVVPYNRYAPDDKNLKISLATGLTVWFPPWIRFPAVRYPQIELSKNYLTNGYPQTRFAQATSWDRFLYKLFDLTQQQQ